MGTDATILIYWILNLAFFHNLHLRPHLHASVWEKPVTSHFGLCIIIHENLSAFGTMVRIQGIKSPENQAYCLFALSLSRQGSWRYTLFLGFYCVNLQGMAMLSNRRHTIEKENSNRHEILPPFKNSLFIARKI